MSIKIPSPGDCQVEYYKLKEKEREEWDAKLQVRVDCMIAELLSNGEAFTQNLEVAEAFLEAGYRVITFAKPTGYKITIKEISS